MVGPRPYQPLPLRGPCLDVTVNGKQLSNVDCATLLGVEIDSKLSFNEHIEKVCKKLASRIAILHKIRACTATSVL